MLPFAKSFQPYMIEVDDRTITMTAANQSAPIPLAEKLPSVIRDSVAHLVGWHTEVICTPTFTTAPAIQDYNTPINQFLYRAEQNRVAVDLSGRDIRSVETFENGGRLLTADPDLNSGSTNVFYWSRFVSMAPFGFLGSPDDFVLPNSLLSASSLEYKTGVLTDFSADTTAMTVRLITTAILIGLDELRIPPKVELKWMPASSNKIEIGDRCLIPSLFLVSAASHAAFTSGQIANLKLDDRRGNVYNGQHAAKVGRIYHALMGTGSFSPIQADPRAATDDNVKIVNGASPTAVTAPPAAYCPVIYSPPGSRIDKIEVEMPGTVGPWSGSLATGNGVMRRILPRGADEVRDLQQIAFKRAGLTLKAKGSGLKSNKGGHYVGRRAEYMPWAFQYR